MSLLLCLLPALLLLHLVAGHSQPRPQVQEEGGQDRQDRHVTKIKLKQVHILTSHILHLTYCSLHLTSYNLLPISCILHLTHYILHYKYYILQYKYYTNITEGLIINEAMSRKEGTRFPKQLFSSNLALQIGREFSKKLEMMTKHGRGGDTSEILKFKLIYQIFCIFPPDTLFY